MGLEKLTYPDYFGVGSNVYRVQLKQIAKDVAHFRAEYNLNSESTDWRGVVKSLRIDACNSLKSSAQL